MDGSNGVPVWGVVGDARAVTAWSATRLAFEPRGPMLTFREDLRQALKRLAGREGEGLLATYLTPNNDFVDVENVTLYNVGAGAYSHLAANGVSCERHPAADDKHHLRYRIDALPAPPGDELLARVGAPSPADTHSPGQWWAMLRPAVEVITPGGEHLGPFSIDVTLSGSWTGPAVAGIIKPLLDGLVAALHTHDGSERGRLTPRLSQLGDPEQVWLSLCDPAANVLGTRTLLRPHAHQFAWNPADERCHAFRVRVVASQQQWVTAEIRALPAL